MPIRTIPSPPCFLLETCNTALVLGITESGRLFELYRGARLGQISDYPREESSVWVPRLLGGHETRDNLNPWFFPVREGAFFREPCLEIAWADGTRDVVLRLDGHSITENRLSLTLADSKGCLVEIELIVHEADDLIEQRTHLRNSGDSPWELSSALTGAMHVPSVAGLELVHLSGQWLCEFQKNREPIGPGRKVLESRRGVTSHQASPFWAVVRPDTSEEAGEVWFGLISCAGNWRITVEQIEQGPTVVLAGRSPHDARESVQPGDVVELPAVLCGYTDAGLGAMSRRLHRYQNEKILPGGGLPRPVLYNSWEATEFDLQPALQMDLATRAAALGVELFVVDDAWFGGRRHDRAGLGDWWVSPEVFPDGMKPLADHVRSLGMRFGLWFEPESVNPDSDLFRANPDWIYRFPGRETTLLRNQTLLNFCRSDVRDHLFEKMSSVILENGIDFIKWDMNRPITEAGWPQAPAGRERTLWQAHSDGVHELMDRLRASFPGLEIEACASGGGRVNLATLSRVEQVWTSDNTDAWDRLFIHDGFSLAFSPRVMMAWVTHTPNWVTRRSAPLRFRFHSAMCGGLGIGEALHRMDPAALEESRFWIETYKSLRRTLQLGRIHRLSSPSKQGPAVWCAVDEGGSEAVALAFWPLRQWIERAVDIPIRGLRAESNYLCERLEPAGTAFQDINHGVMRSGEGWLRRGLRIDLDGDYASAVYRFRLQ